MEEQDLPMEEVLPPSRRRSVLRRRLAALVIGFLAVAALGLFVLDTAIGHRFLADRIGELSTRTGLRIAVGRIDGSIYGEAVLRDVALADSQGVFARIPAAELDWRPFSWLHSGLDVRGLVIKRGTLLRLPKLRLGDPEAPFLPGFDIRIDRLEIDNLKVAKGVLGEERKIGLVARVDIRRGRALIRADGRLGGKDRLFALIDAEPDRDRFDLKLDYAAPRGGLLAGLAGAKAGLDVKLAGKGSWRRWDGALLVQQEGRRLAALRLGARGGRYSVLGQVSPNGLLSGIAGRAAGELVSLSAEASLAHRVLDGWLAADSAAVKLSAKGGVDLGVNAFRNLRIAAVLADPALLGGGTRLEGGRLTATLDGGFRDLSVEHAITASRFAAGTVQLETLATKGTASFDGNAWRIPLDLTAVRIVTGDAAIDPRLVNARATATLLLAGSRLSSDDVAIGVPGLAARLVLRGDMARGGYALAGAAAARGWPLPDLGTANADAKLVLSFGSQPWLLRTNFAGHMVRVDNETLTSIAGTGIRMAGGISLGAGRPLLIEQAKLDASKLELTIAGRRTADGRAAIAGAGRHIDYGPFRVEASLGSEGARAVLVFADPLPAAGLKDVRVALSPITDGFRIETTGDSTLGPFNGTLGLFAKAGGPTRLEVERLEVWKTAVTGSLVLAKAGVTGQLQLTGGGVDGTIGLIPRNGGQGFDVALAADNARFGGENPLTIGSGRLEASGLLGRERTTITGNATAQGIARGNLFIGKLAAKASMSNGRGQITASIAGRRGSRFNLQLKADVEPRRIAVLAKGDFAGKPITMPRRAVLTRENDGWQLAATQLDFGGGRAIASGKVGGEATELNLALSAMPLSLADIVMADLGLGGTASGLVEYRRARRAMPTGSARLQVRGLTRSGLVLTSRPVDLALVANLRASQLETRAVVRDEGKVRGRVQARITGLPAGGTLGERLRAGRLFGQLRYEGPADAIWRLVALDAFDLTGPISVAADATGSITDPQIRGSLSSETLRVQSALTGTDISGIAARGRFSGSRLEITSFSGRAANGGQVTGSGSFDLSGIGERGVGMDLRLAVRNARILARDDMAATVTGPLRIVSDGTNGTIAGRVSLISARWQLGRAAAAEALPNIRTREVNRRADIAPRRSVQTNWRYLIDAQGDNGVNVRGLGLDSEWSANIRLRGTTAAPAVEGQADLVRGGYEFAGKRFELIRGRIRFDGSSPPNPRLDIVAEADESGITARVNVGGTGLRPEITFTSTPALPEEELLSRLLFGNSIADISAPEALQLGAALASLRGGGGLDPINRLRSAIGLDRLRIISADAATGRGTGIAAGKYLGRRFYAEIITDGRGYSATEIEFRVTSWLSLLASVSTIGRESINARISKDY